MSRKIGICVLIAVSVIVTILIKNKFEHNYDFQYIGYLDEGPENQYSTVQDYYYYPETGILIIKVASNQISISSKNNYIDISFLNETESMKTHVILLNKHEKAKYKGIDVTKNND